MLLKVKQTPPRSYGIRVGYDPGARVLQSQPNFKCSATGPLLHPNAIPSKKNPLALDHEVSLCIYDQS